MVKEIQYIVRIAAAKGFKIAGSSSSGHYFPVPHTGNSSGTGCNDTGLKKHIYLCDCLVSFKERGMHMCAFRRNMADHTYGFQRSSGGSLLVSEKNSNLHSPLST